MTRVEFASSTAHENTQLKIWWCEPAGTTVMQLEENLVLFHCRLLEKKGAMLFSCLAEGWTRWTAVPS